MKHSSYIILIQNKIKYKNKCTVESYLISISSTYNQQIMDNYYSSSLNDYSYEYSSPLLPTYYYSPSINSCSAHSPYSFYSSPGQSIQTPPTSYFYYQQQPSPTQQRKYQLYSI